MIQVVIDGTNPIDGVDGLNDFTYVNEINVQTHDGTKYTIWFRDNSEMYIEADSDIKISIVSQYKNTIKLTT